MHDTIRELARKHLTRGSVVPDDAEIDARYLGQFVSMADVYKHLFAIDSPHINVHEWPYAYIDWNEAALAVTDSDHSLLIVDGHYFDATISESTTLNRA